MIATIENNNVLFNEVMAMAEQLESNSLNYEIFGAIDPTATYELTINLQSNDTALLYQIMKMLQLSVDIENQAKS